MKNEKWILEFIREDGTSFTNKYNTKAEAERAWSIADTELDFYGSANCGYVDVVVLNPNVH